MKDLIIAEKPSVAQDIAKSIGGNIKKQDGYIETDKYIITWAVGHLLTIDDSIAPEKWELETLPIIPSQFKYSVYKDKVKQFNVIKKLVKEANSIFIATDAGREGELIARLILEHAGWNKWNNTYRIWTSEALTKEVILRELNARKPAKDFDSLYEAAKARQHADWLVGINLSRFVTLTANDRGVWSIGRVQTPVLKLIVDRELEIQNFKPEPYWFLVGTFFKDKEFTAKYTQNKQVNFKDKETLENVLKSIQNAKEGIVKSVNKQEHKKAPPLLFSITTLQMAANKLGYTSDKTLALAQDLYEAKYISYPRTEANYLDEGAKPLVKNILKKLGREDLVDKVDKVGKRVFDNSKLTDHYAIIPQQDMKEKPESMTEDHVKIYNLIKNRFLAAFYDDYIYETTTVTIDVNGALFTTSGRVDKSLGWKSIEQGIEENEEKEEASKLPDLKEHDKVSVVKFDIQQDFTKPPSRYTEATLLGKMKDLGLGTGATRAAIIKTLKDRFYITVNRKQLMPTDKGISLIKYVGDKEFANPDMTSVWEKELEDIYVQKQGIKGYNTFIDKIKAFVSNQISTMRDQKLVYEKQAVATCRCGGKVLEYKNYYKCEQCQLTLYKEVFHRKLSRKEASSLYEGKSPVFVKNLKSKSGKTFNAYLTLKDDGKLDLSFGKQ